MKFIDKIRRKYNKKRENICSLICEHVLNGLDKNVDKGIKSFEIRFNWLEMEIDFYFKEIQSEIMEEVKNNLLTIGVNTIIEIHEYDQSHNMYKFYWE